MSCPQLASGCILIQVLNSDSQQAVTSALAFTSISPNTASSSINSLPKSFHACLPAATNGLLTCLVRYLIWGLSLTTDVEGLLYFCNCTAKLTVLRYPRFFGRHCYSWLYSQETCASITLCGITRDFTCRTTWFQKATMEVDHVHIKIINLLRFGCEARCEEGGRSVSKTKVLPVVVSRDSSSGEASRVV